MISNEHPTESDRRRLTRAVVAATGVSEAELTKPVSVAAADQTEAAERDVKSLMQRAARGRGNQQGNANEAVALIEVALQRWAADGNPQCQHVASPQPVIMPLCFAAMLCRSCAIAAYMSIRGTAEDRRCDRCARVVDHGPEAISPVTASAGAFVVMAGLCVDCKDAFTRGEAWPA